MAVDTAKVEGRRKVNYTSLQELLTDAERLSAGPVKALGNWSPGQIYRHLAISFNGSIDGFTMNFPWYLRLMARLLKKKLISGAMPPGYKLPPEAAKAVMPGPTSTEDGLTDLKRAITPLEREPRRAEHPMFGGLGEGRVEPGLPQSRELTYEFPRAAMNARGR